MLYAIDHLSHLWLVSEGRLELRITFLLIWLRSLKKAVLHEFPENSATFPEYLRPRPANSILLTAFQNIDKIPFSFTKTEARRLIQMI